MGTKKQFLRNLLINGINFLVNVAVGLLMPPFLVQKFGIGVFGIVQVAISMATYVSLLSTSLNQANNRFVSISIISGDMQKISTTLSTIFTLYIGSFILIIPFILFISFYPEKLFSIDETILGDVTNLFLLVGISQIVIMLTIAYMSPAYAKNRLDIIQGINILRNFLKLVFVFVFVLFISNSLTSVGMAFLLSAVVSVIIAFVNFKKIVPFYRYRIQNFDILEAKKIFHLSGWTIVSVLGSLMFLQTDVVIINIFLGTEESGHYAVLMQWSMLLIAVSTVLSVVISPLILNKYAYGKIDELKKLLYKSIKYQGIFTAIPAALIFVYADTILALWLGVEYKELGVFLQVMIIHYGVSQATRQFVTVNTAYNKMKWHGITTLALGALHITVSILLLKFTLFGTLGVIVSNVLFTLLLNIGFLSWYVSSYLNESVKKVYINLLPSLLTQVFVFLPGYFIKFLLQPDGWIELCFAFLLTLSISLVLIYLIIFNRDEKLIVLQIIKRRI
jgi:membrane protein EpsK